VINVLPVSCNIPIHFGILNRIYLPHKARFFVLRLQSFRSFSFMENNIVFVSNTKKVFKVNFSPLYCVFADDKPDSIILHVSFTREKPPRRRETRVVKYFELKLYL